jgi:Flp pilus assembly protein TadD
MGLAAALPGQLEDRARRLNLSCVADPKWHLSHARGYLGLGMVAEAAAELDQLPAAAARETEALALRALVLQEREQWPALAEAARELAARQPAEAGWWIAWAYATRRSRSLAAAEVILLEAERTHPEEATVQFNLGCYACLRGDLAEARRRVDRAIALDQSFRAAAATDPDLALLRGPVSRPAADGAAGGG